MMSLHIQPADRDLIVRAAQAVEKNLTDFVIEAARREAEAVVFDHLLLSFNEEILQAFTPITRQSAADEHYFYSL